MLKVGSWLLGISVSKAHLLLVGMQWDSPCYSFTFMLFRFWILKTLWISRNDFIFLSKKDSPHPYFGFKFFFKDWCFTFALVINPSEDWLQMQAMVNSLALY